MLIRKTLPYALCQFFIVAFQWSAMLYLPLLYKERGLTDGEVGIVISLFSLATLALVFPMGALSDRIPPRPMMVAGAAITALAMAAVFLSSGTLGLGAGTALAGAGFTLSSISLFSLFFKQVGERRRGAEVSIFNIGGIMGAGAGAWVCGELSGAVGLGHALLFPALFFALAWAAMTLLLPGVKGISFPLLEYGQDLKRGRTWVLIAIMFVASSHAGFEQAGYSLLQTEVIGLSAKAVGQIFFVLSLWMCLITWFTGREYERVRRPVALMAAGLIFSGAFMAASGSAGGAIDFLIYRMLHTGGDSMINLLILVVASSIFARHRSGGAFAFALTVNTASYFLFANLGGLVGEHLGIGRAFHISGAIEAAGGIALLLFRSPLRRLFEIEDKAE